MILIDFQVQHVLRAYSQQLSIKSRISKEKLAKTISQKDEVTLSGESKKMLIIDKIANEMVAQLASGSSRNETGRAILQRLSQEYGRPLDIALDEGQGMAFKILGETNGGVKEILSPAESSRLQKRLYEVTKSYIYEKIL